MQHVGVLLLRWWRPGHLHRRALLHVWSLRRLLCRCCSGGDHVRGQVPGTRVAVPFPRGSRVRVRTQCSRLLCVSDHPLTAGGPRAGRTRHLRRLGVGGRASIIGRLQRPRGPHARHSERHIKRRAQLNGEWHHRAGRIHVGVPLPPVLHIPLHSGLLCQHIHVECCLPCFVSDDVQHVRRCALCQRQRLLLR